MSWGTLTDVRGVVRYLVRGVRDLVGDVVRGVVWVW